MSSYINTIASSIYQDAISATENLESPAVGFAKPAEYKAGVSSSVAAIIKQNNTQLQLLVHILEKLDKLEERIQKLESRPSVASSSNLSADLVEKLQNLTLADKFKRIPEVKGKLKVFTDPLKILKEEQTKARRK